MIETRKSIARPRSQRLEAAVLRHAPLGDVELGQHLDARDRLLGLRRVLDQSSTCDEDAVDAELDRQAGRAASPCGCRSRRSSARRAASSAPGAPPRSSPRRSPCSDRSSTRRVGRRRRRRPRRAPRRARAASPRGAARNAARSPRCARRQLKGCAMRSSAQACSSARTDRRRRAAGAVGGAQQHAAALRAFGERQQVEGRRWVSRSSAMRKHSSCSVRREARGEAVRVAAPRRSSSTSTRRRRARPRPRRAPRRRVAEVDHWTAPGELEDRHVHEDHDGADHQADQRHQHRLEQAREPVDPARQLLVVEGGDAAPSSRPCCRRARPPRACAARPAW